jgi:hypothetical protein
MRRRLRPSGPVLSDGAVTPPRRCACDGSPDQRVAIRLKILKGSKEWEAGREAARKKANEARAEKVSAAVKEQPRDETGRVGKKPSGASREARPGRTDDGKAAKSLAKDAGVSRATAERVLALG